MNIVFLCGSLEPGRDGVGDYTRRLAGELLRHNHQTAIIALRDRQLSEHILEGTQPDEEQSVPILRLSSQLPWAERISRASAFIKTIDPDWISLQYVPFSFHDKGLPFRLTRILKPLIANRPLHIMFHELWVGFSVQSPRRHVWWGAAQRYLVWSLLRSLRPKAVNTHTPLYQILLGKLGIGVTLLPLFSNIPLIAGVRNKAKTHLSEAGNRIGFVIFGGIFPGVPVNEFADEVVSYTNLNKVTVDLRIIGRSGPEQETWTMAWHSRGLAVHVLGEQSPASISEVLTQSSIGLSTTPAVLAGKSGTIAAMNAHGLPVLCVSQPCQPRGIDEVITTHGVFQYEIGNFESLMAQYPNMYLPFLNVTSISQEFVNSLPSVPTKQAISQSALSSYQQ